MSLNEQYSNGLYIVRDVNSDQILSWIIVDFGVAYAYRVGWYGDLGEYERTPDWESTLYDYNTVDELLDEHYSRHFNRNNLVFEFLDEWEFGVPEYNSAIGDDDVLVAYASEYMRS